MEFTEASQLVRDPAGPNSEDKIDMEQYHLQRFLQNEGLCANNEKVAKAHDAVFDAESQVILLDPKKDKAERNTIQSRLINDLRPEAERYCGLCEVKDVCYEFGVVAVQLSYGVVGGLNGRRRKAAAKEGGIPQIQVRRVRGRNQGLQEAV